jgi:predicted nucleic acid-binding protein
VERPRYSKKWILDTSVLISWWRQCRRGRQLADLVEADVVRWATQLAERRQTDAIVTPVYLEMIGGTVDRRELRLTQAFLACFRCVDERRIPPTDWAEALRLAQRIPRKPRPRDLGDCLIRAIANRLNYGVITHDTGFAV